MTVTIVTDNAATLVREGGVVNRDEPPPGYWSNEQKEWLRHEWFTAKLCTRDKAYDNPPVGTVRVVDVHHASECAVQGDHVSEIGWADAEHDYCHPDAEPGKWHLVVEPINQGDDDE